MFFLVLCEFEFEGTDGEGRERGRKHEGGIEEWKRNKGRKEKEQIKGEEIEKAGSEK